MKEQDHSDKDHIESEGRINSIITIDTRATEMLNPSACKLFGCDASEVLSRKFSLLMSEPDRCLHDHYLHHYHGTGEQRIVRIGHKVSGLKKDVAIFAPYQSISKVKMADGKVYTGFMLDMTRQKVNEGRMLNAANRIQNLINDLLSFSRVTYKTKLFAVK